MSNEVIMNSPNGIVVIDYDLKIQDINRKGMELWGIDDSCKGNNPWITSIPRTLSSR